MQSSWSAQFLCTKEKIQPCSGFVKATVLNGASAPMGLQSPWYQTAVTTPTVILALPCMIHNGAKQQILMTFDDLSSGCLLKCKDVHQSAPADQERVDHGADAAAQTPVLARLRFVRHPEETPRALLTQPAPLHRPQQGACFLSEIQEGGARKNSSPPLTNLRAGTVHSLVFSVGIGCSHPSPCSAGVFPLSKSWITHTLHIAQHHKTVARTQTMFSDKLF